MLSRLLDYFSSIWTGVALLALLFVYSSVGSAVPAFRQLPPLEMTEFEWFHWWPFKAMIALICVCVALATIRRIPFRPVNYGVWTIHAGVIILSLGGFLYFTTKVEGDAPVIRRRLVVELPGHEPVSVVAMPGNTVQAGPLHNPYHLTITSIDPGWEILSGDDAGRRAYSVNVRVQSPERTFIRQLLAGYPQYTEDLVQSTEPGPPWTRAKKALGTTLVDTALTLRLDYAPQEWFYLSNDIAKSWALYLREVPPSGEPGPWVERPIDGLPLYNDYVGDLDEVWPSSAVTTTRPLHLEVAPVADGDPLAEPVTVTSYLRYATMDVRRRIGGDVFDPAVRLRLEADDGRSEEYQLVALDPVEQTQEQGRLAFRWITDESELEHLISIRAPVLTVRCPPRADPVEVPVGATTGTDPDLPYTFVEGTGYGYRVQSLHDGLPLPGGEVISVAAVEVTTPTHSFVRWVAADNPALTRDLPSSDDPADPHREPLPIDPGIAIEYAPGTRPPPVLVVGGPEEDRLRLVVTAGDAPSQISDLGLGEVVELGAGIRLTVLQHGVYTSLEARPVVVPRAQRDSDARARLSMIRVRLPGPDGPQTHWLRFHHWPVESADDAMRGVSFRPTPVTLADGRRLELMFSRQRRRLPAPVVLENFVMDTHIGGFSGQNLSVLNWTSEVRFREGDGWGEVRPVAVNDPAWFGGLWYFQAQWDPPDAGSGYGGLNYTVLGVGNRHGVNVMLAGCCIVVLGMIYAFYVKPVIRRRRQQALSARVGGERRIAGEVADEAGVAVALGAVSNGEARS